MANLHVGRLAAIPSYLLQVAAPRQIPHPHCRPAKLSHHLSQSSNRARRPIALWHFKQVVQRRLISIGGAVHDSSRAPARDIRHA